jgi:hypothetical protein
LGWENGVVIIAVEEIIGHDGCISSMVGAIGGVMMGAIMGAMTGEVAGAMDGEMEGGFRWGIDEWAQVGRPSPVYCCMSDSHGHVG